MKKPSKPKKKNSKPPKKGEELPKLQKRVEIDDVEQIEVEVPDVEPVGEGHEDEPDSLEEDRI
jgi:hypothetical protein